jgi:hypothetical protein
MTECSQLVRTSAPDYGAVGDAPEHRDEHNGQVVRESCNKRDDDKLLQKSLAPS